MVTYSGEHRGHIPPHVVFSSLSPSATDFTGDGPHPADPTVPNPSIDVPTAPSLYEAGEWVSASWMQEHPMSCMRPVAASSAQMRNEGEVSDGAPYSIYSENHFANFVDLHSLRSESSESISEKHLGTCQESSDALSNDFSLPVHCQQHNTFASKLLDQTEDIGRHHLRHVLNQHPSDFPWEKCMTQLSLCPVTHTPIMSTPSRDSSEVFKRTVSATDNTSRESTSYVPPYMIPCTINLGYFDHMCNEQNKYGNRSNSVCSMTTGGSDPLNALGENHHACECLGNEQPELLPSEKKYDARSSNPKSSPSEVGFAQPHDFLSELLEVDNLIVDSPCWKGTAFAHRPSSGNDTLHPLTRAEYNSSPKSQKFPELSSEYSGLFSKDQEASAYENVFLKTFKLPLGHKNLEDHKDVATIGISVKNDMASHVSYLPDKHQARRHKCYDSGEDDKNLITAGQPESFCPLRKAKIVCEHAGRHIASITEESSKSVSSSIGGAPMLPVESLTTESLTGNISCEALETEESTPVQILTRECNEHSQCYQDAEENMLKKSDSSSRNQTIFLKLMHNLSVELLSTCNSGSSLQEYEEELLKSVIQNLKASSSERTKVKLKGDDCVRNFSQIKWKNMGCIRNNLVANPEHSASENTDSEFKTSISQALIKLPEDKMFDGTEVSQVPVYKKLWIEAEASVCKLKYELKLSHMNVATRRGHINTQTVPVGSSEGDKASGLTISNSKPHNHAKESSACAATLQCHGGDSAGNGSIIDDADMLFARLKVLESRIDKVGSLVEKCREHQEASKGPYTVEDAVLAKLRILKSCDDNITSLGLECSNHQLDAMTNRADESDAMKSGRDVEASSIRIIKDVEDLCDVGLEVSGCHCQPPPSPAAVLEKTTLPSATEQLEVSGETPAIPILLPMEVPPLSMVEDGPSVTRKDHSELADDVMPRAPVLNAPQEPGSFACNIGKLEGLLHVPAPRRNVRPVFCVASKVKIKQPIGKCRAKYILLRRLGLIRKGGVELDEQAIDRCLEVLKASFPTSLIGAILCGLDKVNGEQWDISASDFVF